MTKIELSCCEGNEEYRNQCLKDRCPIYDLAKREIRSNWPYVGTGYGNLYGNPDHETYLARVREHYRAVAKKGEVKSKESESKSSIVVQRLERQSGGQIIEVRANPSNNDWQVTPLGLLRVDPVVTIPTKDGEQRSIRLHYQEGSELRPRSNGSQGLKSAGYREIQLSETGEGWQQLRRDAYDSAGREIPKGATRGRSLHLIIDESLEPGVVNKPVTTPLWRPRPKLLSSGQRAMYQAVLDDTGMVYGSYGIGEAHDQLIDRLDQDNRRRGIDCYSS